MSATDHTSVPSVLVVEDEAPVSEVARAMLERLGYSVTEAQNGEIALEVLRRSPTDVVLTDMTMPRMGGLELIDSLRREFPSTKIVAMSAGANVLDEALVRGADRIVGKPFSSAELNSVLVSLADDKESP